MSHTHESCTCEAGGCGEDGGGRFLILRLILGGAALAAGLVFIHGGFMSAVRWLPTAILAAGWVLAGYDVVIWAVKGIFKRDFFNENTLMTAASLGAFCVGEAPEGLAVMVFYQLGELLQEHAVGRSRRSIEALLDTRPETVTRLGRDGEESVPPGQVKPGDVLRILPGERIALDGIVKSGRSALDMSALTGEALPAEIAEGDEALSGSVNLGGVLELTVTAELANSTSQRILDLVRTAADRKAPTESFIRRFARVYTPVVAGMAVLLALLPPLAFQGDFRVWTERGLLFLVASCPCALVVSVPLGYFAGLGRASRLGALIKGGNILEALSRVETVVFDKTGTLTKGAFTVTDICPAGITEAELLTLAAYAEYNSTHPLARSILARYGDTPDASRLRDVRETAGRGIGVRLDGAEVWAGSAAHLREKAGAAVPEGGADGTARVYLAREGEYLGYIALSDTLKPDAAEAVARLKALGVRRTVMLTGDNPGAARKVSEVLGLDHTEAGLLPAQKLEAVTRLRETLSKGGKLCFAGDGLNDAPALRAADIGAAMGGIGSQAAIEASDVVLMTDEPSKLADAIAAAKKTQRVIRQNIAFCLIIKAAVMILGAAGLVSMWTAVFADIGVLLITAARSAAVIRPFRT